MDARGLQLTVLVINTLLGFSCYSQIPQYFIERQGDHRVVRSDSGWAGRDVGFHAYDNYRSPFLPPPDTGMTLLRNQIQIGAAEIGDDVNLVGGYPSLASDWGFSIWNSSATQTLTDLEVTLRLYTADRTILGFEHWYQSGGFVPPNGKAVFRTSGGSILRDNIPTREHMFMTIQFSNTLNYDISQIGVLWGGPVTTGSSSSNIYNFTTGQVIDLGGNGDRNLGFFVDTIEAPAPSALLAAAAAAPFALRRRRN